MKEYLEYLEKESKLRGELMWKDEITPKFYHAPMSRHSREALELIKESGLEVEILMIDNIDKMNAIAFDAYMFYGGPNRLPALYVPRENEWYEGLEKIREYLDKET